MEREIIDVKLTEKDEEAEKKNWGVEEFLEKNRLTAGVMILGVILVGAGILGFRIFEFSSNEPKVEILGTAEDGNEKLEAGKITVEAAGEVIRPGVYEMTTGSRVNDLLTAAGGMSAEADREWVSKNINLALKLADGVKIFIPRKGELRVVRNGSGMGSGGGEVSQKININSAPEAELDTLWGVGPATAKKIIDGRPYQKIEELLEKKIVKSNVWERIKDSVTVY